MTTSLWFKTDSKQVPQVPTCPTTQSGLQAHRPGGQRDGPGHSLQVAAEHRLIILNPFPLDGKQMRPYPGPCVKIRLCTFYPERGLHSYTWYATLAPVLEFPEN